MIKIYKFKNLKLKKKKKKIYEISILLVREKIDISLINGQKFPFH
jgi:hypothetical protein